jgi:hypothetical protein
MKKLLYLSLITLVTAHIITPVNFIDPEIALTFAKKANLTSDEMNAGINLYNNLPSQEKPFDLKIESKETQVCYNLKNGSEVINNCVEKKRLATLLITWIQVCIEKGLEEELKKAENMLYQILNCSQGESLSVTFNPENKNNFAANINLDSHHIKFENTIEHKNNTYTNNFQIKTDNESVNYSLSANPINLELSLDTKNLKEKEDFSAKIKGTKELNNPKSYSVKIDSNISYNSPLTGEVNASINSTQSGKAYAPVVETEVRVATEKYDVSAEFTRDDDSFTLNNLNLKTKKAKNN